MLCEKDDDSEECIFWLLVVWTSFLILWIIPGPTFYNTDTILFIWSWVWVRLCSVHLPHYQMVLFSTIDDLPAELGTASSKWLHLDAKNRVLQQELLSMKGWQRKCEQLEKENKKLQQEVVKLKTHIEPNMVEHTQVEQYKLNLRLKKEQDRIS